jgi:hypothetical protein
VPSSSARIRRCIPDPTPGADPTPNPYRLNETKARTEEREKLQARSNQMSNKFGLVVASHYAARVLTSAFSTWVQNHLRHRVRRALSPHSTAPGGEREARGVAVAAAQ